MYARALFADVFLPKILVIPPTLCVAEAVKWLGRIIDSLFPLMTFLKNHQCALPLDQGIVFTQNTM